MYIYIYIYIYFLFFFFTLMTYIGHGPFSHLFDVLFIPAARPDTTWKVLYMGNDFFMAGC